VLPDYFAAKVEADECLTALAKKREGDFQAIVFRPGSLTDGEPTGKVTLGRTKARGNVTRGDVADVAVRLLEREGVSAWLDLLEGEEKVDGAVERVVGEGVNCVEGEDVEGMVKRYGML